MPSTRTVLAANDEFQLVASLLVNRKQRARQRRFVVEGVRPINEAVAHGWQIEALWYAQGAKLSGWARDLLGSGIAREHVEAAPALMEELSAKTETSELLAVVRMPPHDLGRVRLDGGLAVAFDRPASPGNLGAVIRSADAFGADGVIVTGHAADIYDPQTVRASTGSVFALPIVHASSLASVEDWLARARAEAPELQVVGSSAKAVGRLETLDATRPTVLVVGNETRGLGAGWRQLCGEVVAIPMRGSASSLNVAAAASILLWELRRRRADAA